MKHAIVAINILISWGFYLDTVKKDDMQNGWQCRQYVCRVVTKETYSKNCMWKNVPKVARGNALTLL